jgi:hypothetical protein
MLVWWLRLILILVIKAPTAGRIASSTASSTGARRGISAIEGVMPRVGGETT